MDLASARYVKYIAADASVKTQMDIASREIKSDIVNNSGYKGKELHCLYRYRYLSTS